MTDLIDIARSGLAAYRGALAATTENIANAATEGYLRRDVTIQPLGGARATAASVATGGQGAQLTDVRRAFDGLAAARLRDTGGAAAAASAHAGAAQAIETLMLPGRESDEGVDGALRGFFDALADLSGSPTDRTVRARVLQAGGEVAGAIAALAGNLADLRGDIAARATAATGRAQGLLRDLAEISQRLAGQGQGGGVPTGALHALADRRDMALANLAQTVPIAVEFDGAGVPTVRLGHAGGPLLLQGDRTAQLSVAAEDLMALTVAAPDGRIATSRSVSSGEIGGLGRALGALDMAATELDGFARSLAGAANALHRRGSDLDGQPGGDLFRLQGWQAVASAANGGITRVTVAQAGDGADAVPLTLSYDATAGLWRARDLMGAELATGSDTLVVGGLTLRLDGAPADGDRVTLTPVAGRARDLVFVPQDTDALAAAGAFATVPASGNAGVATAAVRMALPPAAGPGPVADLTAGGTADLLGGAVGVVPTGTATVALQSWGRSAATTVGFPAGASTLTLDLGGSTAVFDLSGFADAAQAVAALQSGALRSAAGDSLPSLGLTVAEAAGGGLRFVRPGAGTPVGVTLDGTAGTLTGTEETGAAAGGSLQVLTRNGRHVAGTPLTAAEAAALITPANGFLPGAVYDPAPLGTVAGEGYRGTRVARAEVPGLQMMQLAAGGTVSGAALPLAETAARQLTLTDATGAMATVDLPAAASAALAAARLNAAVPGLSARATTGLQLSALPDGPVAFDLRGTNGVALRVSATVAGGNGAGLAQAVNALAAQTGVRAEVSPDGGRVLLVQDGGHDITLSGLSVPVGTVLRATPAAADGTPGGAPLDLGPGMALRQGGTVQLQAAQGFSVTEGAVALASAPDTAGPVQVQTAQAGAEVRLQFVATPDGPDGDMAFTVTTGGTSLQAGVPAGLAAPAVAAAVAAGLRAGAPTAELTGTALAALPADGATLGLTVDGATYVLRMQGGLPVVSGPEAGRVTASFDGTNRLVIRAEGVTDGRGITVAEAPAMGFAAGTARLVLTGRPPEVAGLPATVEVEAGGLVWAVELAAGSVTVPPGFPGTADVDAGTGALRLGFDVPGDAPRVGVSRAAGFGGPGAAVQVQGDSVVLTGGSAALAVTVAAAGALGQSLQLDDLPPEDLVVAMTGSGTLRLSAQTGPLTPPDDPGHVEVVVTDAVTGAVALRDAVTGETMAEGRLDAQGAAMLGGVQVQVTGRAETGDRFRVVPAAPGSADAAVARDLAALRRGDDATGSPGVADRLARLQSDAGVRAAAAGRAQATAAAAAETAERQVAAFGAVDLDTEAARLVELQQAYQANAQAISIARSLFDTLIAII